MTSTYRRKLQLIGLLASLVFGSMTAGLLVVVEVGGAL
jgi:hypothetical protein